VVARAQQPAVPVIGFLSTQSADDDYKTLTVPFLRGLQETGYVAGQNVAVEYRHAENQLDRLPAIAADLVRRRVALAAKAATMTIPIAFAVAGDPVALGLVASLNRPGANLTGSANLQVELAHRRFGTWTGVAWKPRRPAPDDPAGEPFRHDAGVTVA
jgi:putative tryptophan/tyrosine transport system substrate-binding protein